MKSEGVWFLLFSYLISCQGHISYQSVVISSDNKGNLSENGSDIKPSKFQEKAEISGKTMFRVDNRGINWDFAKGVQSHVRQAVNTNRQDTFTSKLAANEPLSGKSGNHVLTKGNRILPWASTIIGLSKQTQKSIDNIGPIISSRSATLLQTILLFHGRKVISVAKHNKLKLDIADLISGTFKKPNLLVEKTISSTYKSNLFQSKKRHLGRIPIILRKRSVNSNPLNMTINSVSPNKTHDPSKDLLASNQTLATFNTISADEMSVETASSIIPVIMEPLSASTQHGTQKPELISTEVNSKSMINENNAIKLISAGTVATTHTDTRPYQPVEVAIPIHTDLSTPAYNLISTSKSIPSSTKTKNLALESTQSFHKTTVTHRPQDITAKLHGDESVTLINDISNGVPSEVPETTNRILLKTEGSSMNPDSKTFTTSGPIKPSVVSPKKDVMITEGTRDIPSELTNISVVPEVYFIPTAIVSGISGRTSETSDVNTIISDIVENILSPIQSESEFKIKVPTTATSRAPDLKNTVKGISSTALETSTILQTTLSIPAETEYHPKSTSNLSGPNSSKPILESSTSMVISLKPTQEPSPRISISKSSSFYNPVAHQQIKTNQNQNPAALGLKTTRIYLKTESSKIKVSQPSSLPVMFTSSVLATTKEIPVDLDTHTKLLTMRFTTKAEDVTFQNEFITTMLQTSSSNPFTRTHSSTIVERSSATASPSSAITEKTTKSTTHSENEIEQNQNIIGVNDENNIINPVSKTSHNPLTMTTNGSSATTTSGMATTSSVVTTMSSIATTMSSVATTTSSAATTTSSAATTSSSVATTTSSVATTTSSVAPTISSFVTTTSVLLSPVTNLPIPETNAPTTSSLEPEPEFDDGLVEPPVNPEPTSLAEPGPDWLIAKEQWSFAWEVHLYFFGSIFVLVGLYCLVSIVRLWTFNRLLSKKYFVTLNVLIFFLCALRAVYLLVDGYNSNGTYHTVVDYLLYSTAFPCLTSAFSILMFALLQATRMRIVPPSVQKFQVLIVIIIIHFVFSIATDVVIGLIAGMKIMMFVCQLVFILWGLFLFFGYAYIFRQVYGSAVKRQKMFYYSGSPKSSQNAQSKSKLTLSLAVKITFGTAIFGLITIGLEVYGIAGVYGIFSEKKPDPWPWWSYHTVLRLTECLMCLTISYIASQPFRYKNTKQMCDCCFLCAPCLNIFSCDTTGKFSENVGWSDTETCVNNITTSLPSGGKKRITLCDSADIIPIVIPPSSNDESQPSSLLIIEDGYVRFPTDNDINQIADIYNGIKKQQVSNGIINGAYQGQDINNKKNTNEIKLTHFNRKGSMASSEPFRAPSSISLADSMVSELDKAFKSMRDEDIALDLQTSINSKLNNTCSSIENAKNIEFYLDGQSKSIKSKSLRRSNSEAGEINVEPSARAKLYRSQSDSSGVIRTKQFDNMRYMSLLDLEQAMLDDNSFHSEDSVDFSREDVYVKNPEILRQCSIDIESGEGLLHKHSDQVTEL